MRGQMLLALVLIIVWNSAQRAEAQSAAAAIKEAQRSGRPIFAVAGATSCPHCVTLMKRLSTEEQLQPLIAQYVPLKLDVSSRDFAVWEKFFPRERSAIPALYIVTPQGEQLYGSLGSLPTDGLAEMMLETLAKAGRYPSKEEWQQLAEAVREAEKLLEENKLVEAAEKVAPYFEKLAAVGPLVEYHETGKSVVTLAGKFQIAIAEFCEGLQPSDDQAALFDEALALVQLQRVFADWPQVAEELTRTERRWARNATARQLLRRTRELDLAVAQLSSDDPKQAAKAVRQLNRLVARSAEGDPVAARAAAALDEHAVQKTLDE